MWPLWPKAGYGCSDFGPHNPTDDGLARSHGARSRISNYRHVLGVGHAPAKKGPPKTKKRPKKGKTNIKNVTNLELSTCHRHGACPDSVAALSTDITSTTGIIPMGPAQDFSGFVRYRWSRRRFLPVSAGKTLRRDHRYRMSSAWGMSRPKKVQKRGQCFLFFLFFGVVIFGYFPAKLGPKTPLD